MWGMGSVSGLPVILEEQSGKRIATETYRDSRRSAVAATLA